MADVEDSGDGATGDFQNILGRRELREQRVVNPIQVARWHRDRIGDIECWTNESGGGKAEKE